MTLRPVVIKASGDTVENPEHVRALAAALADLQQQPCIVVHGGGRAIDRWLSRLGIEPIFREGLRVTDEPTLEIAEMILSGQVNTRLTLALLDQGLDALGMSGVDRNLIRAEQVSPELGRVGRVVAVRSQVLLDLCAAGVIPVISPISAGVDGRYNLNADHAAGAIAGAVDAERMIFLTNVPGVLENGAIIARLSEAACESKIEQGVISGGMIPKVRAALEALHSGAAQVLITDLEGLRTGSGTLVIKQSM